MKIVYYECDKCKRKMTFREITTMGLIGKSFELCKECSSELKKWLKEKKK